MNETPITQEQQREETGVRRIPGLEHWKQWPEMRKSMEGVVGGSFLGWRSPKRKAFDKACDELEAAGLEFYGFDPRVTQPVSSSENSNAVSVSNP